MIKQGYTLLFKVITGVLTLSTILWWILDQIQHDYLEQHLYTELQHNLQHYSDEDHNDLDAQFKISHNMLKVLVNHTHVQNYIAKKPWLKPKATTPKTTIKNWYQLPPWLPRGLELQTISPDADVILLDNKGQIREFFHHSVSDEAETAKLVEMTKTNSILQQLSHDQFYLTQINSFPYLIISADIYTNDPDMPEATMMLLIPLNSDFLFRTKNMVDPNRIMLLVKTSSNIILASSYDDIEQGISLDTLKKDYQMFVQPFYANGNSDLEIKLVTLISTQPIKNLIEVILKDNRIQRAIIAFSLVVLFVTLSFFAIRRVRMLSEQLISFASNDLGVLLNDNNRDELKQLISLFSQLTKEIRTGRERLHKELEEKEIYLKKIISTQKQLVQAQKLESIGQLAAGIAHEINTPTQYVTDNTHFLHTSFNDLMLIIKYFYILLDAAKTKSRVSPELLEQIEISIEETDLKYLCSEIPLTLQQSLSGLERITTIVKAMKEFSHPGSDNLQLLDINHIIKNIITVSKSEWKYVAKIETDLAENIPQIYGNSGKLGQVFLNIIVNAAHAIEEIGSQHPKEHSDPGLIQITSLFVDEQFIQIRITDNGSGIPEDIIKRVFDPFFTTKEVGKGTGQGLSIAYAIIVEQLHGSLNIESEPGQGTTFIIDIPLENTQSNTTLPVL